MVNKLDQIKTGVLKNAFVVVMKNKINMIENILRIALKIF